MTVLVVGATGTVGPHVIRALAALGEPARALARDADRARAVLPAGTDIRPGDAIGAAGISFINARDVGECAARVLTSREWDGQTLVLTGPRAVTFAEIADMVSAQTGQPAVTREITPADVRIQLEQRGMARWEAEHFEEMYQLFRDGRSEFVSDDVERLLGRPPGTVEDHLAAHPGLAVTPADAS